MDYTVASFAHDINNKISILVMQISAFELKMDQGLPWDEGKKSFQKIKIASKDITQMIRETVQDHSETEVDIKEKIVKISQAYDPEIIKISIESFATPKIKMNMPKFERVVTNIIQNSIDQKAKLLRVFIRENSLIFHDDGGGTDPVTLMKINSGQKATTKEEGTGLGLFSIYELANKMNWKFEVENRRNEDAYPKTTGILIKFIFSNFPDDDF